MQAAAGPWPRALQTTLVRCLLLAALVHLWLMLLLGTAPGNVVIDGWLGGRPGGQGLSLTLGGAPPPSAAPAQGEAPRRAALGPTPRTAPAEAAVPAPERTPEQAPALQTMTALPSPALSARSALPLQPTVIAPAPPEPLLAPAPDLALPSAGPLPELAGSPAAPVTAALGASDEGARVGLDGMGSGTTARMAAPAAASVAPAASAAQPARRLDLSLSRAAAVQRSGGALALLPAPPLREDRLAREIEKAGKPDCSKAHAGMGLLAVLPLVLDALGKDSCKW